MDWFFGDGVFALFLAKEYTLRLSPNQEVRNSKPPGFRHFELQHPVATNS